MKNMVISESSEYQKTVSFLKSCSNSYGFLASKKKSNKGNYDRLWARDSMICGLAGIMSGDEVLIKIMKKSLLTLMKFQHNQGEIPSNVDPIAKKVSFGGSSGRVDAQLWFLIGFGQYVKKTKDISFAKKYYSKFHKTIHLVRIYEFNHKSLIYVPQSGDWADEYLQEGYILYDQLLYLQAFKEFLYLQKLLKKSFAKTKEKVERIEEAIQINFWLKKTNIKKAFNPCVYEKHMDKQKEYFLPFFHTNKYGSYFDLFGNSLAILLGIANVSQKRGIFSHAATFDIPPAFSPVITKKHHLWKQLINNYSVIFRNYPYEYHNGGIWPMVLGFYAAAKKDITIYKKIQELNSKNNWEFNEVYHGKTKKPIGVAYQAWSAAGAIIAYCAIKGNKVFL